MGRDLEWIAAALAGRTTPPSRDDWGALFALATVHGIDDPLAHRLRSAGVAIPADLESEIAQRSFMWRVRSQRMRAALVKLVRALEAESIRVVPLKGPLLAERLYPEGVARPTMDLDLLLDEESLDGAIAIVRTLGYAPSDSDARAAYHRKRHYHLGLEGGEEGYLVELHFRAHRTAGALLESGPLLDRAVDYMAADGTAFRVLAPEDEILFLAAHAGKDVAVNLRLLYDLALFVERHGTLDWPRVFERARSSGLACALTLVLEDLETWLGVETPRDVGRRAPRLRRYARTALRRVEAVGTWSQSMRTSLTVANGALVEDTAKATVSHLVESGVRIARRRAQRWLPGLVPESWAG